MKQVFELKYPDICTLQAKRYKLMDNSVLFTTRRLKIIQYALPLLAEIYELYSDSDVIKYTTTNGRAKTTQELTRGIEVYTQMYANTHNARGKWLIADAVTNKVVGYVGLFYIDEIKQTEISYALMSKYRGNGFAAEAALGMAHYALTKLQLPAVCALIGPDNIPSQNVAQRIGMVYRGKNVNVWGFDFKVFKLTNKSIRKAAN